MGVHVERIYSLAEKQVLSESLHLKKKASKGCPWEVWFIWNIKKLNLLLEMWKKSWENDYKILKNILIVLTLLSWIDPVCSLDESKRWHFDLLRHWLGVGCSLCFHCAHSTSSLSLCSVLPLHQSTSDSSQKHFARNSWHISQFS